MLIHVSINFVSAYYKEYKLHDTFASALKFSSAWHAGFFFFMIYFALVPFQTVPHTLC